MGEPLVNDQHEADQSADTPLAGQRGKMIGTSGKDLEVGVEAVGPSPAAVAAEADRLRIVREGMILRREL